MRQVVAQAATGDIMLYVITIGLPVLFVVFAIYGLISTSKAKKERKKKQAELKNSGVIQTAYGEHMAGLPLAEGAICTIYEFAEKFRFIVSSMEFNLEKDKITDIAIKTSTEITEKYVSSIGGAVAGAALFGPLGAIVGGRAKKKKNTQVSYFLIFTYLKEGGVDYISFDVSGNYIQANNIKNEFIKQAGNKTTTFEL